MAADPAGNPARETVLELDGLSAGYDATAGSCPRSRSARRRRRSGRPPRPQRSRQDHDAACDLRPGQADDGRDQSMATTSPSSRPLPAPVSASLTYPKVAGCSSASRSRSTSVLSSRGEHLDPEIAYTYFPSLAAISERYAPACSRAASSKCSPSVERLPANLD